MFNISHCKHWGNQLMYNQHVYIHTSTRTLHTIHQTHPSCRYQDCKTLQFLRQSGMVIQSFTDLLIVWFGSIGWLVFIAMSLGIVCLLLCIFHEHSPLYTAMWLVDFLYTLPMEWRAIWSRKRTGLSILFFLNRYLFLGYIICEITQSFDISHLSR